MINPPNGGPKRQATPLVKVKTPKAVASCSKPIISTTIGEVRHQNADCEQPKRMDSTALVRKLVLKTNKKGTKPPEINKNVIYKVMQNSSHINVDIPVTTNGFIFG